MKSLLLLAEAIIKDCYLSLGTCSARDLETVRKRHACEGDSFLTITLPQLDDLLTRGLSSGYLPDYIGWGSKSRDRRPKFLFPLWEKIFDSAGRLQIEPSSLAIYAIRQISRAFKKVFEICDDAYVQKSITEFLATEKTLCKTELPSMVSDVSEVMRLSFGTVVRHVVMNYDHSRNGHGPGSVAERLDSVEKWKFDSISPRISEEFGFELFRGTWNRLVTSPPDVREIPARLIAVPKTATKPRLISIEPSYNQFVQQGLRKTLEDKLDYHPICSYKSNEDNQRLARLGSLDSSLATIDLSEASDRVRLDLVERLFDWSPTFLRWIKNSRSVYLELPDGRVTSLKKFASMGSALTFPIESMVFSAIVMASILRQQGKRITRSSVREIERSGEVRVYGDDIIMPSQYVPTFMLELESFSLKVNREKSFSDGYFRESCGADWYRGIPVKPVYVRRNIPTSRHCVEEIISLSSFRDQFVTRLVNAKYVTEFIDRTIIDLLGFYPWVEDPTVYSGVSRRGDGPQRLRFNTALQRIEMKMYTPSYSRKETKASTDISVEAFLRSRQEEPDIDEKKYTHNGRPFAAKLKQRWIALQ